MRKKTFLGTVVSYRVRGVLMVFPSGFPAAESIFAIYEIGFAYRFRQVNPYLLFFSALGDFEKFPEYLGVGVKRAPRVRDFVEAASHRQSTNRDLDKCPFG